MVSAGRVSSYPDIGLAVNLTRYDLAGDSIDRTLSAAPMTASTYARRHLVTKGSFTATFKELPNEVDTEPVGAVWPPAVDRQTKFFTVTATQDNSEYLCVVPRNGGRVDHAVSSLTQGEVLDVPQGTVLVVMGACEVFGAPHAALDVIVLLNNAATVIASEAMQVHQFWNSRLR
jgi:hypothetical protein